MTNATDHPACATHLLPADAAGIAAAVALLADGGIAALPTETVYGLAADAENDTAVARIFAAKGRPAFNPLIVHVADQAMAERYARFPPLAERLTQHFWPGALTLVLPLAPDSPAAALVTAGLATIAIRAPAHPVMQAMIRGLGHGIAAPSANASGRLSATSAVHVLAGMEGRVPLVLDGGPTAMGLESSIIRVDGDSAVLLRHGAVPQEAIEAAIGRSISAAIEGEAIAAPGMMLRHYAPRLPLRMNITDAEDSEWHIGFGPITGDETLSATGNMDEAAARLFDALHRAETSGRARIAIAPIPEAGIGAAINDRLRRAARG